MDMVKIVKSLNLRGRSLVKIVNEAKSPPILHNPSPKSPPRNECLNRGSIHILAPWLFVEIALARWHW
jgi:hypothetical protein